ncbi:hypothetical protein BDD12DRAFT_898111 [Trichophaea hybrida]|nr:hypothetical protein BDD12DRAFT_898111 [Trichophaea hybrida]
MIEFKYDDILCKFGQCSMFTIATTLCRPASWQRKKPKDDDDDLIFELFQTEQCLSVVIPFQRLHLTGNLGFMIRKQLLAEAWNYLLYQQAFSATAKGSRVAADLSWLMDMINTARKGWSHNGELFQQARSSIALTKIHLILAQVTQVITNRTIELGIVHRHSGDDKQVKKVITWIN